MCRAAGESRGLKTSRGSGLLIVLLAVLLSVGGCATGRGAVTPSAAAEDYLAAGESAYFGANVAANRDLVSYVVASLGANADVVIRRVDLFAGSISLGGPAAAEFSGVAFGRFPKGATQYALWRDRGFNRSVAEMDSGKLVYFTQTDGLLEVAVPDSGIILMSTGSVVNLASQVGAPSERGRLEAETADDLRSVSDFPSATGLRAQGARIGPDIVIVFPEPAEMLVGPLGLDTARFPIQRLSLAAFVTDKPAGANPATLSTPAADESVGPLAPAVLIELVGVFEFSSEMEAALFGRLGRVFILGFMRSLGLETGTLRDTVTIEVDGSALTFGGVAISPDELVNLIVRLTGQES
jgi:hypothetical protein